MLLKNIIDEDYTNYKKCSMVLGFPSCTFKCEKEPGGCPGMCQNSALVKSKSKEIDVFTLWRRYIDNPLSHAIVCAGLEPFDSFSDLLKIIEYFRAAGIDDDFVIYTGYYPDELVDKIYELKQFNNIIVKFGRYKPNEQSHYDEVLGVNLASSNQWAERIS